MFRTQNCIQNGRKFLFSRPKIVTVRRNMTAALTKIPEIFPDHSKVHERAKLLKETLASADHPIRIAVIPFTHKKRSDSKQILEALLNDPLASDMSQWYPQFEKRDLGKDTLVKYNSKFISVEYHNSVAVYPIPSPFLVPDLRDEDSIAAKVAELKEKDLREPKEEESSSNDVAWVERRIEFLEINPPDQFSNSSELLGTCHLHIYVTNDYKNITSLTSPVITSVWPKFLVIDCKDSAIVNSRDETFVSVDSSAQIEANRLYSESAKNVNAFLELSKKSNIRFLKQCIERKTLGISPLINLQECIVATLRECMISGRQTDEFIKAESEDIHYLQRSWGHEAHTELQSCLVNDLTVRFQSKLIPWYALYWKFDDIESVLGDLIYERFMVRSLSRFDYVMGKISNFHMLKADSDKDKSISTSYSSPLMKARNDIMLNDIPELQAKGVKLLTTVVSTTQLPLVALATCGYFLYDFSLYSMASVSLLGLVLGFRALQSGWNDLLNSSKGFVSRVVEKTRLAVVESQKELTKSWDAQQATEEQIKEERQKVLEELEASLIVKQE